MPGEWAEQEPTHHTEKGGPKQPISGAAGDTPWREDMEPNLTCRSCRITATELEPVTVMEDPKVRSPELLRAPVSPATVVPAAAPPALLAALPPPSAFSYPSALASLWPPNAQFMNSWRGFKKCLGGGF